MKKFKVFTTAFMVLIVGFFAMQCQHDDEEAIPVVGPDPIEHGTEIISCMDCNIVPAGTGIWYHDKSHSNVMWETQYKVFGSKLTGRFNSFFIDSLKFDEAVPSNIYFDGYVWLNTVNTGEPGRDDGCLETTFGTDEPLGDNNVATNKAILTAIAGTGRYSSTDAGFLVNANFTFLSITKEVTVKMFFAPKFSVSGTIDGAGLNSVFEITSDDFLPLDSNIGDVVTIEINSLMRIKK